VNPNVSSHEPKAIGLWSNSGQGLFFRSGGILNGYAPRRYKWRLAEG
jgi:hypothetical protein